MGFYSEKYIPVQSEYDKIDIDNRFLIIRNGNLEKYLIKYNCDNQMELEDILWINYGITLKIV